METIQDVSLTIRRTIDAPVSCVYAAWTDPEALRHWFCASEKHECTLAEADVRIGGRYQLAMRDPDGDVYRVSGVYREIETDHRLVFTWAWEHQPEQEMLVTIELSARGAQTDLVLIHRRFADTGIRDLHDQGWSGCLGMLTKYLESAA